MAGTIKLVAVQPIEHDGKAIAIGKSFEVSEEAQAEQLIAAGSAETPAAHKARVAAAGHEEASQG